MYCITMAVSFLLWRTLHGKLWYWYWDKDQILSLMVCHMLQILQITLSIPVQFSAMVHVAIRQLTKAGHIEYRLFPLFICLMPLLGVVTYT